MLELSPFYPKWNVNTVSYAHRPDEIQEFQILHFLAARYAGHVQCPPSSAIALQTDLLMLYQIILRFL